MDIRLSWDLFIMVFFVVIMAYSMIVGRDNTLKVILGTYVAALAADSIGSLFTKYLGGSEIFFKFLKYAALGSEQEAVVFIKVLAFITLVILFAVKGCFTVETVDDRSPMTRFGLTLFYAAMSASLIIITILTFVSGVSFVGGGSPETTGQALWEIYNQSRFVRWIVENGYLCFSVPALAFLVHSIYSKKHEG